MPNYELKFALSETSANYIAELRGTATEDEFFRRAMEMGICQITENTARMNLDFLTQVQTGTIGNYGILRGKLFAVGEPQAVPQTPPQEPDEKQPPEFKDPMMGLKPMQRPRS